MREAIFDRIRDADSKRPMREDALATVLGVGQADLAKTLDALSDSWEIMLATITRGGETFRVVWPTCVAPTPIPANQFVINPKKRPPSGALSRPAAPVVAKEKDMAPGAPTKESVLEAITAGGAAGVRRAALLERFGHNFDKAIDRHVRVLIDDDEKVWRLARGVLSAVRPEPAMAPAIAAWLTRNTPPVPAGPADQAQVSDKNSVSTPAEPLPAAERAVVVAAPLRALVGATGPGEEDPTPVEFAVWSDGVLVVSEGNKVIHVPAEVTFHLIGYLAGLKGFLAALEQRLGAAA